MHYTCIVYGAFRLDLLIVLSEIPFVPRGDGLTNITTIKISQLHTFVILTRRKCHSNMTKSQIKLCVRDTPIISFTAGFVQQSYTTR